MSTLRVNSVYLNDAGNTTVSIANSWNVAVTSGGQTRLQINNDGNIGIGTSSPAYNFHLKNSSGNAYLAAQYGTGTIGYMVAASNEVQLRAFNGTNDVITFATGASERMRIDSSGNVGIGTSSPNQKVQVNAGATSSLMQFTNTTTGSTSGVGGLVGITSGGDLWLWNQSNYNVVFGSNNGERMRIDSSGNVGIGTTSPGARFETVASGTALYFSGGDSTVARRLQFNATTTTNTGDTQNINALGSTGVIAISTNSTERMRIDSSGNLLLNTTTSPTYAIQTGTTKSGSPDVRWEWGPSIVNNAYYVLPAGAASGVYINSGSTSWSSNSDERLKNITANIENAAQSVNSLRAVRFTWKSDEENKPNVGLIAQDVLAVLPEAVTEDRGYYGVKYTDVVPLLVAAIQELSAKNDALEARLSALEAK